MNMNRRSILAASAAAVAAPLVLRATDALASSGSVKGLAGRALRVALPFPNGQFCRRHLRTIQRYLNLLSQTCMLSLVINMH